MDKTWFTLKKLYPNIWGLGEFKHSEEVISYLFVGEKNAFLFDTGLGVNDISKVVHSITPLPVIVLNSHSHYDHVGGNKYFKKILNPKNISTISIPPYEFIVIHTPGHTPDSICLFEKNMRILCSGDTFYPGPIYLHLKESNFKNYKKSIIKLNKLSLEVLLPGHNKFMCKPDVLKSLNTALTSLKISMLDKQFIKISNNLCLRIK